MTGIAGIVIADNASKPSRQVYERLLSGIRYRGPDGIAEWRDKTVCLIHAHLACVPVPTHNLDAGEQSLKCIGDIRLDNRADVAALCGITGPEMPSDMDLVLAAYAKFGPDCCTHFIGDFAFAIWDSSRKQLFCARDPFGVRPFFYRAEAGRFAFASDEAALGANADNPGDEAFVAEFLAGAVTYTPQTRHPGISRLLGGHRLIWSPDGLDISRYWELIADKTPCPDPAARFQALFTKAVEDRLYGTDAVATFLSGGMDSSSIAVVASELREKSGAEALDSFSFVYPKGSEMDESPYIDAVLHAGRYSPHKMLVKDHVPLGGAEQMIADQKGPIIAAGMAKSRQLYPVAAQTGSKVILDGHGGDEVVGYGSLRIIELARKGQWLKVLPLIHTHSKLIGDSRLATWLDLYRSYGPQNAPARMLLKLVRRVIRMRQQRQAPTKAIWQQVLSEEFQTRTDLTERFRSLSIMSPDLRDDEEAFNRWPILSDMMQSSFEVLDKASAVAGIEARYPFFDTRLVAFCIGLPASEKLRFGETRSILRRALKGILPDKVRLRQTKTSFHPEIVAGLRTHHMDILQEMQRDPHNILAPYVNSVALHALIDKLQTPQENFDGGDAMFLWRLCSFYIWRRSVLAPVR